MVLIEFMLSQLEGYLLNSPILIKLLHNIVWYHLYVSKMYRNRLGKIVLSL